MASVLIPLIQKHTHSLAVSLRAIVQNFRVGTSITCLDSLVLFTKLTLYHVGKGRQDKRNSYDSHFRTTMQTVFRFQKKKKVANNF